MELILFFAVCVVLLCYGKKYFNGKINPFKNPDLTNKIVIITGANNGIGKETAKEISKTNATVIFACRNE